MASISLSQLDDIKMELQSKMLLQQQVTTQECLNLIEEMFTRFKQATAHSMANQHLLLRDVDQVTLEESAAKIKYFMRQLTQYVDNVINVLKILTLNSSEFAVNPLNQEVK